MLPVDQCPVCGGEGLHFDPPKQVLQLEGFEKFLEVYSADVCQTCGTIYQNPRISELEKYYAGGSYRVEHPPNPKVEEKRALRLAELIERFKIEPKSCLDIGSGSGVLLKYLEVFNYAKVLGLEYDRNISEIDTVVYSKDDVEGKFDLITCIHVMEHMPHPAQELKWMLSKLNEGGTILLEIPTYLCNDLSHLFVPTRKGLEMMLDGLNFLYLESDSACNILIGDRYKGIKAEKVYYTYESPDFGSQQEVLSWLKLYYEGAPSAQKGYFDETYSR
ncbi:MAG: class I SAM-dependent methyltransferase [Candidatus Thorarchaeota archaeon]